MDLMLKTILLNFNLIGYSKQIIITGETNFKNLKSKLRTRNKITQKDIVKINLVSNEPLKTRNKLDLFKLQY